MSDAIPIEVLRTHLWHVDREQCCCGYKGVNGWLTEEQYLTHLIAETATHGTPARALGRIDDNVDIAGNTDL